MNRTGRYGVGLRALDFVAAVGVASWALLANGNGSTSPAVVGTSLLLGAAGLQQLFRLAAFDDDGASSLGRVRASVAGVAKVMCAFGLLVPQDEPAILLVALGVLGGLFSVLPTTALEKAAPSGWLPRR